ncbi:MAG TPA: polysaccharide deacetylase [bacterium]|nr:polysaccharide deacetylase [bacterium]
MGIYQGRFPVMLTFDVDGETLWLNRDPQNAERPVVLSQGRYGPVVGVPRLLRLLARYDIKATFFIPGWIVDRYPDMVRAVAAEGHEVGHHGYLHEWPGRISAEQEVEALRRGIEAIERVTGCRPLGYRAPGWDPSPRTFRLLVEHGFRYSSNMMDADGPYRHVLDGAPTALVELPVDWALDDSSLYLFALQLPNAKLTPNPAVFDLWAGSFDGLYREGQCCVLTMHPQLTGKPYRAALLEQFIQHVLAKSNVTFARCLDVADAVAATAPIGVGTPGGG